VSADKGCVFKSAVYSVKNAPARNEQFGASGGAVSYDTEQVTASLALVQTFPNPPPDAKLRGVVGKCYGGAFLKDYKVLRYM
jgi:hypothetical protein